MLKWLGRLMRSESPRFRTDAAFVCLARAIEVRVRSLSAASRVLYVARASLGAARADADLAPPALTVGNLRLMLAGGADAARAFAGQLMLQTSYQDGSVPYWRVQRAQLLAACEQVGNPHLYLTGSAADAYWADLVRLLGLPANASLTARLAAVSANPAVCVQFFRERFRLALRAMFGDRLKHYWFRYEFQKRGSVHAHCVVWLHGAPALTTLLFDALEAQRAQDDAPAASDAPAVVAEPTARDFCDFYVSTFNPAGFDPSLEPADSERAAMPPAPHLFTPQQLQFFQQTVAGELPHPCTIEFADVPAHFRLPFIAALAHMVQRHTRCGTGCLRNGRCRFMGRDPEAWAVHGESDFVTKTSREGHTSFIFRSARNDPRMNRSNPLFFLCMLSNTDVQIIMNDRQLKAYISKYVCKRRPRPWASSTSSRRSLTAATTMTAPWAPCAPSFVTPSLPRTAT